MRKVVITSAKNFMHVVRNHICISFRRHMVSPICVKTINNPVMVTLSKPQRFKSFFGDILKTQYGASRSSFVMLWSNTVSMVQR